MCQSRRTEADRLMGKAIVSHVVDHCLQYLVFLDHLWLRVCLPFLLNGEGGEGMKDIALKEQQQQQQSAKNTGVRD
jgi:hypothetical protein